MKDCVLCGEIVPVDQWRWWCPECGATIHYACAPGGVPVAARPVCPCEGCDGVMSGVESAAARGGRGSRVDVLVAYKVAIIPAPCVTCPRTATCVVYNNRNEEIGPRCTPCGDALVESMNGEGR